MSRCSVSPRRTEISPEFSRRHFLRQLLGAGAFTLIGGESLLADNTAPEGFRFAFLTDLHLMPKGDLRSAQGIAACLAAVEKLSPKPDFILVGGDLVDKIRDQSMADAQAGFDLFLKIWKDNTSLPTHWTFGNHDLACSHNSTVSPNDPLYGKGLFKQRLQMPDLSYGFTHRGWRVVVLDDVVLQTQQAYGYIGQIPPDEAAFATSEFKAHSTAPTIVCTHIPLISNLPIYLKLFKDAAVGAAIPGTLVCENSSVVTDAFSGNNIRAVLCGHLHYYEKLTVNGIPFINSGAVCASYWKGPNRGCPEGFGVVDVGADSSVAFDYRTYGWKA